MKRLHAWLLRISLCLAMVITNQLLRAQPWQRIAADNFGITLVDDRTIVIVGAYGKVLRSIDGGVRWTQPYSGTYNDIYAVAHLQGSTLVAVGDSGTILRSSDVGATWMAGLSGVNTRLWSVAFPSPQVGYACGAGGTILRTSDSGKTWSQQGSTVSRTLRHIAFSNASEGVAVGDSGTIVRTTDGGADWNAVISGTSQWLYSVRFANERYGLAVGSHGITLGTSDGGSTWTSFNADTIGYRFMGAVWLFDTVHAVVVGDRINDSKIAQSNDGGRTWNWNTDFNAEETWALYDDVVFRDSLHGFTVGIQASVKATDDGGATWHTISYTPFNTPTLESLLDISFVDRDTGMVLFGNAYLRTTDGGVTWNDLHVLNLGNNLISTQFLAPNRGLLSGAYDQMFVSTNQGLTWDYAHNAIDPPALQFWAMNFSDANFGVCSASNLVYFTNDGGNNWHGAPIPDLTGADSGLVFAVDAVRPGIAFVTASRWVKDSVAATSHEVLFKTRDTGANWQRVLDRPGYNSLKRSWFLDPQHGFVGGSNGIIYHTDNGGDTWDSVATGAPGAVSDIRFFTDKIGYAVTFKGAILSSSDGGRTWQREYPWPPQPSDSTQPFYRVNMLPDRQTIMVTGNSLLLRKVLPEPLPA
ncbi:MAG TPA: YCF48-related protein, partial [Candidatus Kapabacteria bacterium]|nr:YCF48-related protein [Candidatus Kapabacteria bacterium]